MGTTHARLRLARYRRWVRRGLDLLPDDIAAQIRNLVVVIADEPDDRQRAVAGGADLLGLYEGTPLTERGAGEPLLPDRITIFLGPISRVAPGPHQQRHVIVRTVIHEIAHHFGLSDERLEELGLGGE